jgi:hypothetical protein
MPDGGKALGYDEFLSALSGRLGRNLRSADPQSDLQRDLGFDSVLIVELGVVLQQLGGSPTAFPRSNGLTIGDVYEQWRSMGSAEGDR